MSSSVLSTVKDLLLAPFGRRRQPDPSQIGFEFSRRQLYTAEDLLAALRDLGLRDIEKLRLTRNRNVMVSFGERQLRVHTGFLDAPEVTLRAIVTFVNSRARTERSAAKAILLAHPIAVEVRAPRQRQATHSDDDAFAAKLSHWHARYNQEHFAGSLNAIAVRVSRRMKSRLGHFSPPGSAGEAEIAISRSHIRRHGWQEALATLLHEMVHQWQHETGVPIDHGPRFRKKCREIGITPFARRVVGAPMPGRARVDDTAGTIPVHHHSEAASSSFFPSAPP